MSDEVKPSENNCHLPHQTMALIPIAQANFQCLVLEQDQELLVDQPPLQLIQQACLKHYATYEGRKKAITKQHGFKRKVPIPIDPKQGIYAFPTHTPTSYHCHWIFLEHILRLTPDTANESSEAHTKIIFKMENNW